MKTSVNMYIQIRKAVKSMNNVNNHIAFKEIQKGKLVLSLIKKYLLKAIGFTILLELVISVFLLSAFLKKAENIVSIQNIPITRMVALEYINPLNTDTTNISIGSFISNHKFDITIDPHQKVKFKLYKDIINELTNNRLFNLKERYVLYFWLSLLVSVSISIYLAYYQYKKDVQISKKEIHMRGMQLLTQNQIETILKNKPHVLSIGNIHIPTDTECKHILVFGASGSGKSVLLSQFLYQINDYSSKHQDKRHYILVDVKPEFVSKFSKPDDFIFCPFDKRSLNWTIFNDIDDISDYDTFASLLFENKNAKDPYWGLASAAIFADGLKYLAFQGKTKNKNIIDFFNQPIEDIKEKINTLPSELITSNQHLNSAEGTISSIISTLVAGLLPFKHLKDKNDGTPEFSFKRYIREEYKRSNGTISNLYFLVPSNRQQIMAPLLALAMDIMINEALTLPESKSCRLYFIIDEIGSVNKIQLLPDLVTKGRSYGISILALTQDPGLLRDKYGPQVMLSFLNNFGTQIVLRINDSSTAKELSENFGSEEKLEYKASIQLQEDGKKTPSYSKDTVTSTLILPSELQNLEPFHGYGKIVGFNPFKLTVPKVFFNQKYAENFIPIDKETIEDYNLASKFHKIKK